VIDRFTVYAQSIYYSCETTLARKYCLLLFCFPVCFWVIFFYLREIVGRAATLRDVWMFSMNFSSLQQVSPLGPEFWCLPFYNGYESRAEIRRETPKHSAMCNATAPFASPKWFSHVPLLLRVDSVLLWPFCFYFNVCSTHKNLEIPTVDSIF